MRISIDDKQIRSALAGMPELTKKAIKSALYNVSAILVNELEREAGAAIDRPTRFTVGNKQAWYTKPDTGTGDVMTYRVGIKRKQAAYLQFLVKGLARDPKIIERRTPDGRVLSPSRFVQLDAYGNVPRAQYLRIFRAAFAKKKRSEYFFLPTQRGKLYPGIYKRNEDGKPRPMFFANTAGKNFGKRFDFYGVAERVLNQRTSEAIAEAIAFRLKGAR